MRARRLAALAAAALAVAAAGPARAQTDVHVDMFMLGFGRADLRHAPLLTSEGARQTGAELGLDHLSTIGMTPYVAPHVGVGVETWRWLFYVDGGYLFWGFDDAGNHATDAFLSVASAPRLEWGPLIVAVGPSLGVRWLAGDSYHTGARPLAGVDADLRLHTGAGGGKHGARMSMDWFLRLSYDVTDGSSWMISFGEGWGSQRASDGSIAAPPR